jgi:hypothetical protein
MTRVRVLIALLILVPVAAVAASHQSAPPEPTFGANDEATAAHRWMTNQPRHWRHVVVHR